MKSATIGRMQASVLAVVIISAVPALFAQRNSQQVQPQVQQPMQQPPQQSNQPAQGQMQAAPAAQTSWCANRPLCYEANDFVVTVTEFRTSTDGRGSKILDAMLHFQNKTNQPISLGYVDQSGSAIDDMGNRFMLNTFGGGVRGMGVVAGNNMDPKFTLPAGGGGDARFELWWPPYGKLAGVNYEMEFSIREMNRVEGNQWTLGDESLIHYQGLANGMGVAPVSGGNSVGMGSGGMGSGMVSGGNGGTVSSVGSAISNYVPGQANATTTSGQAVNPYGAQPCPPGTTASGTLTNVANAAGAQNQNANNAVSNATSAISSIGSLFGHKKNAANAAAPNATNAVPCTPATNPNTITNATTNPLATPVANTAVPQTAGSNPLATPVGNAKGAAIGRVASTPTTAAPRTPVAATAVTQRAVTTPARTAVANQQTMATAVTKTSPKQPAPAAKPPAAVPAKKPATTTAPANGSGGA